MLVSSISPMEFFGHRLCHNLHEFRRHAPALCRRCWHARRRPACPRPRGPTVCPFFTFSPACTTGRGRLSGMLPQLDAHRRRVDSTFLERRLRARTPPPAAAAAAARAARAGTPSWGAPPPASAARTSGRRRAGRACPCRRPPWGTDPPDRRTACTGRRRSTAPTTGSRCRAPVSGEAQAAHHLVRHHFVAQQVARAELGAVAALVAGRFADVVHLLLRARPARHQVMVARQHDQPAGGLGHHVVQVESQACPS